MLESEPQTSKEAMNFSEGPLWKETIKSEIDSIMQNHTLGISGSSYKM